MRCYEHMGCSPRPPGYSWTVTSNGAEWGCGVFYPVCQGAADDTSEFEPQMWSLVL